MVQQGPVSKLVAGRYLHFRAKLDAALYAVHKLFQIIICKSRGYSLVAVDRLGGDLFSTRRPRDIASVEPESQICHDF